MSNRILRNTKSVNHSLTPLMCSERVTLRIPLSPMHNKHSSTFYYMFTLFVCFEQTY